MRLPTPLHRLVVAAVVATGIGLFGTALQGVARMDTSLEVAAARATPDRALIEEARADGDCPYRGRDHDREPV